MDHQLISGKRSSWRALVARTKPCGSTLVHVLIVLVMSWFGVQPGMGAHGEHTGHDQRPRPAGGALGMDVCASDGSVHLLLAVAEADAPLRLDYLRSDDDGARWSDPVRVSPGDGTVTARRGSDARIAAYKQHLVAVWTTAEPGTRYGSGPLASALSDDGGKTWQRGPAPSIDPGKPNRGQGFIGLSADASGVFHLAWLDGRSGSQGVIYARSADFGKSWQTQVLVATSCQCCWNTVAVGPDGRVGVLYRARDPRDMTVIRSMDQGISWGAPVTVGEFDWKISACPHCGGGLVMTQRDAHGPVEAHAAVWTGADVQGGPGVWMLRSSDGGTNWESPQRIGDNTAFHPDLGAAPDSAMVVAFEMREGGQTAIFAARSIDGGARWDKPVRLSDPSASATHPRVVWTGRRMSVFWTQRVAAGPLTWAWCAMPQWAPAE